MRMTKNFLFLMVLCFFCIVTNLQGAIGGATAVQQNSSELFLKNTNKLERKSFKEKTKTFFKKVKTKAKTVTKKIKRQFKELTSNRTLIIVAGVGLILVILGSFSGLLYILGSILLVVALILFLLNII